MAKKQSKQPDFLYFQEGLIRTLILCPEEFVVASQIVTPSDFTDNDFKYTFQAIGDMVATNTPVTIASLTRYFSENGIPVSKDFIFNIVTEENQDFYFKGGVVHWAEQTKTESTRYQAILALERTKEKLLSSADVVTNINTISEDISEILANSEIKKQRTLKEQILEHKEETLRLKSGEGRTKKIPFPYDSLNHYTGGMGPGNLIVIAARTGVGKTVAGVNIAKHAIDLPENYKTMFFALEMPERELLSRIIASETQIKVKSIDDGNLTEDELHRYMLELERLSNKNLIIDDTAEVDIPYIKARAMKQKKEHGLDLIIIDYIQLIKVTGRSSQEELAYVSRELKLLAKALEIPVVALTQVNREKDDSEGMPRLADIRGSGAIANDSSIVVMIDRKLEDEGQIDPKATFNLAKNRQGEVGKFITVSAAMEFSLFIDNFSVNRTKPKEEKDLEDSQADLMGLENTSIEEFEEDFEDISDEELDIEEDWE